MSEPLNVFLETVEELVELGDDDDAELGRQVRAEWAIMIDAEKRMTEFCKSHDTTRAPCTVMIPGREWPYDR